MADEHALHEALLTARSHLVVLEGHLDRAAETKDLEEVGRAWARASQVEQVLRSVLPPGATDDLAK